MALLKYQNQVTAFSCDSTAGSPACFNRFITRLAETESSKVATVTRSLELSMSDVRRSSFIPASRS